MALAYRGRIIQQGTPASLKSSICSEVIRVAIPQDKASAAQAALTSLASVSQVRARDGSLTVFLADGAGTMVEIVRVLDRASVPVESLSYSAPTLDDVFLRATGNRLEGNGAREEAS